MAEPISAACLALDDLWGAGFPDPVLGDTGNGTHLLYPVDLPNDSDITCLGEAPEETASTARPAGDRGYDGEGQIDGEILVKARGLLQYLGRDGPTDGTDPALQATDERPVAPGLGLDAQIL